MTMAELLAQIARRDKTRSEATLQADIRQLILTAPLSLSAEHVVTADLETPVGVRRRIDIEVGSCLIEVKRDLAAGTVLADAIVQLADYLPERQAETGSRYVGILTDGADWRCLSLPGAAEAGPPHEVSAHKVSPTKPDAEAFLIWLDGVLATAQDTRAARPAGCSWSTTTGTRPNPWARCFGSSATRSARPTTGSRQSKRPRRSGPI